MCCQRKARGVCLLPLIEVLEVPPDLLHIRMVGVGRLRGRLPIPLFQYSSRSVGVCLSHGRLQARSDIRCCLLRSSPGICHEGPEDGSGEPPLHVAVVERVLFNVCTIINKQDGIWGHPEGARGAFQFVGDRFQGLEVLKICADSDNFHGGGSVSGNALLPQRYWAWQRVGRCSSRVMNEK